MNRTYGYCRISTNKQNIARQIRNITHTYPDAKIIEETYTGTTTDRPAFDRMIRQLQPGDTVVFDSVSRMSRNAQEGFELYKRLYDQGIQLIFLKEPQINTTTYRQSLQNAIPMTGTAVDPILEGVNAFLMSLAETQIRLAFEQSQKEVDDLRQRTREGIETARRNGKQIGRQPGSHIHQKREVAIKEQIQKYSRNFNGTLTDPEVMKLIGDISRGTYYKYKAQLR